jgi:aryl carrier-like protein
MLQATPATWRLLLEAGWDGRGRPPLAALCGGEAMPRSLADALLGRAAAVWNLYGPTETTVWSAAAAVAPGAGPVPVGRPVANTRAYVLDGRMRPAPVGVAGELYLGGDGLARGYLRRPALTAERFVPDPFGPPGGRLYRTGDLARWRGDGQLECLGRLDHQVKVRGHRIELGEVEAALGRHPAVRQAVAVVRGRGDGDAALLAYVVPADGADLPSPNDLRRWLRTSLPDVMVPSAIVALAALPLTPNGKVDRKALPDPDPARAFAGRDDAYAAPRNPVEETLARAAAEILGLGRVGIHENFFDLGIDSILSLRIVSRARQAGVRVNPGQLFRHQTIAELAPVVVVEAADGGVRPTVPSVPMLDSLDPAARDRVLSGETGIEDAYPLSPAQAGMLFHTIEDPESGVYLEQFTCILRGDLRVEAFHESWRRVLQRHAVLRTAFPWFDSDQPSQVVYRQVDVPLEVQDWRGTAPDERRRLEDFLRADRRRGFVPSMAPLLRLALLRLEDDVHQFVWSFHHMVMDGWCLPIVLNESLAFYEAALEGRDLDLPRPRPFRDYIDWLQGQDLTGAEAYWREALRGVEAPTPLHVACAGSDAEQEQEPYEERWLSLSRDATAALLALSRAQQVTLNTVVQGAYALLLGRYSGQADVVFGMTSAGRPAELEGVESMVGMFINTLPMRVLVDEDAALVDWLKDLQGRQVDLLRHESSPLVRVQHWCGLPRGRALFESIFVFENYPMAAWRPEASGGLGVEAVRAQERTNYPLTLTVLPGEEIRLRALYDTRRFDALSIDRLLGHLQTLLGEFVADPGRRLCELSMLSEPERRQLVGRPDGEADDPTGLEGISEEEVDSLLQSLLVNEEDA